MTPVGTKRKIALTYGLFAGIALVLILFGLYKGGVASFMGIIGWIKYPIIIVIAVLAALKYKKLNGGYIPYVDALWLIFLVFALGFLLETMFHFILMNYIDPAFRDALAKATLEKMATLLKRLGSSEEEIEKLVSKGSDKDSYTLSNMLLGYGVQAIICFIFALIVAAFVKKNKPEFDNTFNQ